MFAEAVADLVEQGEVADLAHTFPELLAVAQGGRSVLRFLRRGILYSSVDLEMVGGRVGWAAPGTEGRLPRGG